jgi:prepilin-type N-terminal cleavage/methylation domain-containing protein
MRGFSLIEVMIASAMLGIGLAALLTAFGTASGLETHQERVTAALHLAEGRMEELLLRFPDSPDLRTGVAHGPVGYTSLGDATTTNPFFQVTWRASAGPIARTRRLEVKVTWKEGPRDQSLTLASHRS